MEVRFNIFQSRLGRRMFLLFVLSALIPILILFGLSYSQVSDRLQQLGRDHLRKLSKGYGMAVYDRLLLLKTELRNIALVLPGAGKDGTIVPRMVSDLGGEGDHFRSVLMQYAEGQTLLLSGPGFQPPSLSSEQRNALASGQTVLAALPAPGQKARLFMFLPMMGPGDNRGILTGEIGADYLWGFGAQESWPHNIKVLISEQDGLPLLNTLGRDFPLPASRFSADVSGEKEELAEYTAARWSVFLQGHFFAPNWSIALAQKNSDIYAPLKHFRHIFPLVALLALWVVLLLSLITMRKSLGPLKNLQEGTLRLAGGDFGTLVQVNSRDEFLDLADSFNAMSHQLADQFKVLSTIEDLGRTVLSRHETATIVETALRAIQAYRPAPLTALSLMTEDGRTHVLSLLDPDDGVSIIPFKPAPCPEQILGGIAARPKILSGADLKNLPSCLKELPLEGIESLLMFPLFIHNRLAGILIRGSRQEAAGENFNLPQIGRLAEQVAVGLSNADLMAKLKEMNWGALKALARTVDAKSPWTAGHSERVTALAVKIGRQMGLDDNSLDNLLRAGLLHDIGKIGIAREILDKPGKLTAEEYAVIKTHPRLGIQILEPIQAYAPLLPLILHHHEQFDGNGYPSGLAGAEIPLGARILAISDVYDALRSDRPYRLGWPQEQVLELIAEQTGKHFDPEVSEAFLEALLKDGRMPTGCHQAAG
ncbi:MAG: HD domain-containing protein [Deltaproteobacteria bacterium]|nr:HD domain-containing protein [Deltaproteobacteria bacterium]